jgi:hypothetical protein
MKERRAPGIRNLVSASLRSKEVTRTAESAKKDFEFYQTIPFSRREEYEN